MDAAARIPDPGCGPRRATAARTRRRATGRGSRGSWRRAVIPGPTVALQEAAAARIR